MPCPHWVFIVRPQVAHQSCLFLLLPHCVERHQPLGFLLRLLLDTLFSLADETAAAVEVDAASRGFAVVVWVGHGLLEHLGVVGVTWGRGFGFVYAKNPAEIGEEERVVGPLGSTRTGPAVGKAVDVPEFPRVLHDTPSKATDFFSP